MRSSVAISPANVETSRFAPWLLAALWLAMPNALFWWAAWYFGYQRPWFNLDYFAALFLWSFGWRYFGWICAFTALTVDVLAGFSQVYVIFDIRQLLQLPKFTLEAPVTILLLMVLIFFIFSSKFYFICKKIKSVNRKILISMVAPIVVLNIPATIRSIEKPQDNLHLDRRIVIMGSQLDTLAKIFYRSNLGFEISQSNGAAFREWKYPTAANLAWGERSKEQLPKRMLLVVVESFGVPVAAEHLAAQLESIHENPWIRTVNQGAIYFSGGTISGELRELCALLPLGIDFGAVQRTMPCWPEFVKNQGYQAVSISSASGTMYRHNEWAKEIGFDREYYRNNIGVKARNCYSFPSLCDVDLTPLVKDQLLASPKTFVYWLTSNSHLPYDVRDLRRDHSEECKQLGFAEDSARCIHHGLVKEFIDALTIMLAKPEMEGVEVVITGDHAPPFFRQEDRQAFSAEKVPFLHLRVESPAGVQSH
ncbi:MAG: hypothetical protein Q4G39_01020 [Brachymonas sp.]|nr:hypothetical protein [Brachymonas sp.]